MSLILKVFELDIVNNLRNINEIKIDIFREKFSLESLNIEF